MKRTDQTDEPRNPLVRQIWEERRRQGLTAYTVGALAGYDDSLVGQWERGRSAPRMQSFIDVVEALGGQVIIRFPDREVVVVSDQSKTPAGFDVAATDALR